MQMTDEESAAAVVAALKEAVASGLVTIDADRGHFNPEILEEVKEEIFDPINYSIPLPGFNEKLLASLGKPQGKWSSLFFSLSSGRQDCYKCGESTCWEFNGTVIRLATRRYPGKLQVVSDDSPCPFADGLPPIVTRISVPSGQILVGNDLRHIFDEKLIWGEGKNEKYSRANSINHHAGKRRYVERYAQQGMLTGFLGSGGVGVYHHPTGIIIAPSSERPKTIYKEGKKYTFMGHISLGLWWYGAADYERCLTLNKEETLKTIKKRKKSFYIDSHELVSLKVEPGTYEMVHQAEDKSEDELTILSQIQLVK